MAPQHKVRSVLRAFWQLVWQFLHILDGDQFHPEFIGQLFFMTQRDDWSGNIPFLNLPSRFPKSIENRALGEICRVIRIITAFTLQKQHRLFHPENP